MTNDPKAEVERTWDLAGWQKKNCVGCRFADKKKAGTGKPCCTHTGGYEVAYEGHCKTRQ